MIDRALKLVVAGLAPLLLLGCVLTPGKFVSTMTINADRSFAFTYKGEVIAIDPGSAMKKMGDKPTEDIDTPKPLSLAQAEPPAAEPDEDSEAKNRAIAAALAKEAGYRSAVYQGKGKFLIDYAITGVLTHSFVFPFNADAEAVFPFIVVELRSGKTVRIKAPGFSSNGPSGSAGSGMANPMPKESKLLDGTFTLDTDADVVSQNNEDGAKALGKRRVISWRVTPLTKDAPTAVLQLAR